MTQTWQLAEAVALRQEAFGGMAFHRQRGITLEVDQEAYDFLCTCLAPGPLPPADHPASHLVPQLVHLGFLQSTTEVARPADIGPHALWAGDAGTLSAPETVHVMITTRCNLSCPGCYVPRQESEPELTVADWCNLIAQWAQMRVFQIAVGGGEPLLYDGLFEVLAYARQCGLVPNLTTNGTLLDVGTVRRLQQAGVARVNVSWNSPGGNDRDRKLVASHALRLLLESSMQVGLNLLVTPTLLPHLPHVLAQLQALGVRRVTILRPKPAAIAGDANMAWYTSNQLRHADLLHLRAVLTAWLGELALEVDSALVGLMGDADPAHLRWRGIHGCTAGRRICTIWPDGRVTACSFLGDLDAGNVRSMPFAELWKQGRSWELLRSSTARSGRAAAVHCGSAHCIDRHNTSHAAQSFHGAFNASPLAGDAECPSYREAT